MSAISLQKNASASYVYLWAPTTTFLSFGHLSLELSDGTYISFWPRDDTGLTIKDYLKGTAAQSQWIHSHRKDMDLLGHTGPVKTIPVFDLDIEAIKAWWDRYKKKEPMWSLTNSCSNIVYIALCEGSEEFRETQRVEGSKTTPASVAKLVEKGFNKKKKGIIRCGSSCIVK